MFCTSLFVLWYFFVRSLCCLFFYNIRLLINPLVSFGHCVVCSSSIYRFWLTLWYLQTVLIRYVRLRSTSGLKWTSNPQIGVQFSNRRSIWRHWCIGAKQRKSDTLCEFGTRSLAPTTWLSLCLHWASLPKILLFLELLSFWYFIGYQRIWLII